MNNLPAIRAWLRKKEVAGVIVPSTDEYLSEFAQPHARRLAWATGFGGSTGSAIIGRDRAALFVDGRYREQANRLAEAAGIETGEPSAGSKLLWASTALGGRPTLAFDPELHSELEIGELRTAAAETGVDLAEFPTPVDSLWTEGRPPPISSDILDYPERFAGLATADKLLQLRTAMRDLSLDALLLCDPEDVSWLLNIRTDDARAVQPDEWHIVPIPLTRAIVRQNGKIIWFVDQARVGSGLVQRLQGMVDIRPENSLCSVIATDLADADTGASYRKTSAHLAALVRRVGRLHDTMIAAKLRWQKHPNEIQAARRGHFLDGLAVIEFLAWLQGSVKKGPVTELEASRQLDHFRRRSTEYCGPSMPYMSASGPNGALPHYVPAKETDRDIGSHPIYWMDSGGQYPGCSTDNTVCIAVGKPEPRHIDAHTRIVKGLIALSLTCFPDGTSSYQLDAIARQYLWAAGLDYAHGTGHGVGNMMNIHEGPSIRKEAQFPTVGTMRAGMTVSNEPAYYARGDFGIRVETHMVTVEAKFERFLTFETISRLPIDARLLDSALLTKRERQWLFDHHRDLLAGFYGQLSLCAHAWLADQVERYAEMMASAHQGAKAIG